MNTPTLSPAEALILEQLREKPIQHDHIGMITSLATHIRAVLSLEGQGLIRESHYEQLWRTPDDMVIYHLTHEGRTALLVYEGVLSPYFCPDCKQRLKEIKGLWGCLCQFGGKYPTAAQVERLADREEGAV